jgi:hypothetical protein
MPSVTLGTIVTMRLGRRVPAHSVVERRSTTMLGRWTSWRFIARASSGKRVRLRISPGMTVCIRVRSGRAASKPRCTTALIDGRRMRARGMRVARHAYAAGGTLLVAHRAGSSASVGRMRADAIGVRVYACADCGRVAIRVNGRTRSIVSTRRRDAGFVTIRALRFARTTTARVDVVALDTGHVVRIDGVVPWRSRG